MIRIFSVLTLIALATTTASAREILIPYNGFKDLEKAKQVKEAVDHATFYRKLNKNRFKCSMKVMNYLMDNMALTSTIMRQLELEKYVIERKEDGTMVYDDKQGMTGTFEPVFETPTKRVFYGDGHFDAGVLGNIRGESVLVMDYAEEPDGILASQVTVFIRVHGMFAPLCKMASPVLNGLVGSKSASLLDASVELSKQLTEDPAAVYAKIKDCDEILPAELAHFRDIFLADAGTNDDEASQEQNANNADTDLQAEGASTAM